MIRYEYKSLPFQGVNQKEIDVTQVAGQLTIKINEQVNDGWEFVQHCDVGIWVKPGCIAGLFGAAGQNRTSNQLIFRRPAESSQST